MFRPNLFRSLVLLTIASVSSVALSQQPRGNWQLPGVRIPRSQYQAPIVDYYNGQTPQLWDEQQPVERLMGDLAQRSWLRIDYLHWSFAGPGNVDIGAPVVIDNPSADLVVFDIDRAESAGVSLIPNMGNVALDDTSGIRGTWGLDLANAQLELEFFGTEQNHDGFQFTDLATGRDAMVAPVTEGTASRPNIVTPLLTNGAVQNADSANFLVYDNGFQTTLTSQMWGAEASLLTNPYVPGPGVTWQWLGGFRYLVYEEEFRNRGINTRGQPLATAVNTRITSIGASTVNNMYGPEVGARISAEHRWFTFSATPRVAFTINDYTGQTFSTVPTEATPAPAESRFSGSDIEFTPIVQVSFTGELHVTPNFSIFGGYDLMWIYRMTRPYDNIDYDSTPGLTGGVVPNINQEIDLESFYARGLSVGCVWQY